MRSAVRATSTVALLLSATTIHAQDAAADAETVYLDVDGAAVQVSVALAAEACGLEEAVVLQTAATRLKEIGLDPAALPQADAMADNRATSTPDVQDAADAPGTDAALADDASDADQAASEEEHPADTPTEETAAVAPDASNETVTTAQGTADPSTAAPGDEMLALAICRIDVVTAGDLGIPQANEIVTD